MILPLYLNLMEKFITKIYEIEYFVRKLQEYIQKYFRKVNRKV